MVKTCFDHLINDSENELSTPSIPTPAKLIKGESIIKKKKSHFKKEKGKN